MIHTNGSIASVLTGKFNRSNDSLEVVDEEEFYRSESDVSSSDNEGGVQLLES